jgi:hypothetical protein
MVFKGNPSDPQRNGARGCRAGLSRRLALISQARHRQTPTPYAAVTRVIGLCEWRGSQERQSG